jgi:hypothetical protein
MGFRSKFIADPWIDKPWMEYFKGKATTIRALAGCELALYEASTPSTRSDPAGRPVGWFKKA